MGGGGQPSQTTQTTKVEMSPEQRQLYQMAIPKIAGWANSVPQRYQGSQVAGFDEAQIAGQNMALGAAGTQQGLAQNAADTANFYTGGDIWNPASNPNLQGAIDAATRPITENFTRTVLPSIKSEAISTGNFGSSRQGVAEGLAAGEMSQAVGDTASKLVQDQYRTNIQAQLSALGMTPMLQDAALRPAVTTSGVGDVRQALAQALLGEQVSNFNYDQMAPYLQGKDIASLVGTIPGGTTTSTGTATQPGGGARSAMGGAMTGFTLGNAIMPGIGGVVGGGAGALLPFLL